MQLLQENISSAQKKKKHVGTAISVQIEAMSSSPMRNPQSGTASEMADMINYSRSGNQRGKDIAAEKPQRKSNSTINGQLRNVPQPARSQKQYNLRSNTDNAATSQRHMVDSKIRPDTYDVSSEPYFHQGSLEENPLVELNGKKENSRLSQEERKSKKKSKRSATTERSSKASGPKEHPHQLVLVSGNGQGLEHSSTEAGKVVQKLPGNEVEISTTRSDAPLIAEQSEDSVSKLNLSKTRGRPRKNREETWLSLRQSQNINSDKHQHVNGNPKSSSAIASLKAGRSSAKAVQEDHHVEEAEFAHHSRKTRYETARAEKGTSSGQKLASSPSTLPNHGEQDLEHDDGSQEMISQQDHEDSSPTSYEKGADENFKPEDMFDNGNVLNAIFITAYELSKEASSAGPDLSRNKSMHLLVGKFQEHCSQIREVLQEPFRDEQSSEYDTTIFAHCSEIFNDVRLLAERYSTQQAAKRLSHKVYLIVMCGMASLFRDLLKFYKMWNCEEEALDLRGFGLNIAIKVADCIVSFQNSTKSTEAEEGSKTRGYVTRANISRVIVEPLEKVCKALKKEREKQEAHASLLRRKEEVAYLEKRKAQLRERRERAEARKDEWHSLHVARLAAEPDPRRFAHLRLKELASDTNLDANGDPFERLELFAPRVQASPAAQQSQLIDHSEWTDVELAALLDGLKTFKGPSVFNDLFAAYCGPGAPLRQYNVQQITRKAAYLRRTLMRADLSQDKESEDWINSIPVYE